MKLQQSSRDSTGELHELTLNYDYDFKGFLTKAILFTKIKNLNNCKKHINIR